MTTDLIIIGAGPGGYHTAAYAAHNGLSVVIIEKGDVGGTCLNCGCIPTKALCHDAEAVEAAVRVCGARPAVDFAKIAERKRTVVSKLRQDVETLMSQPGITLVRGEARFTSSHTVIVGGEEYTAENIIIATGSRPKMPPVAGINLPGVMTSTELLDIDVLPQSLCIVGAGVIGLEFASVFNSFGCDVTVVEFMKECLPPYDGDISRRVRKAMEKRGIKFYMQAGVSSIEECDGKLQVSFECKRKPGQDTNWSPDKLTPGRSKEIQGGLDYYVDDREGRYIVNGNVVVAHSDIDLVENTDKVNFLPTNDTYEYIRSQSRDKSLNVSTWHNFYYKWKNADLQINPSLNYNKYDNRNTTLDGIFNEQQTGMSRKILENLYSPTASADLRRAIVYRYSTE